MCCPADGIRYPPLCFILAALTGECCPVVALLANGIANNWPSISVNRYERPSRVYKCTAAL